MARKQGHAAERFGLLFGSLSQDLRYAVRTLRKVPGFTAIVIVTLALGVGANTAIFSVTYSVLLKPLAYKDPSRLAQLDLIWPQGGELWPSAEGGQRVDAATHIFEKMAIARSEASRIIGDPSLLSAAEISGEYFATYGIQPVLGRTIQATDTRPESARVVMLSEPFWRSHFGGDPTILGKKLNLVDPMRNSAIPATYTVVGVGTAPAVYDVVPDLSIPLVLPPKTTVLEPTGNCQIVVRLKRGISIEQANSQLRTASQLLSESFSQESRRLVFHVKSLQEVRNATVAKSRVALLVLLGAVGFLLLIACVNVSSLMMARAWNRRREIAIREALGASRFRVTRQLLVESLLLSSIGGVAGIFLGFVGMMLLRAHAPAGTPSVTEIHLYPEVLGYALVISLLAGLLSGLAPAFQVSDQKLATAINDSAASTTATGEFRGPSFYRSCLIIVEVALSVVLLIGSGLAIRSFAKLVSVPLGLRTDHTLKVDVRLDADTCKAVLSCQMKLSQITEGIRALPGVQMATLTPIGGWSALPLQGDAYIAEFELEGESEGEPSRWVHEETNVASVGYFSILGMRILQGRDFAATDTADAPLVVVVNETFAKRYFSGSPIGKRLPGLLDEKTSVHIVGVVNDARDVNQAQPPQPEVYYPVEQWTPTRAGRILVRTVVDPSTMAGAVREEILAVSKSAVISDIDTMDEIASRAVAEPRFRSFLLGAFAVLGLLLAVVGIYGVVSYSVRQRTHEIGVRMALGAGPRDVLRLVLSNGLATTVFGIALGVGAALALTRYLQSLLFEVTPTDPATFAGVAILFLAVAFAACYIPARRAMRVDPMDALRYE